MIRMSPFRSSLPSAVLLPYSLSPAHLGPVLSITSGMGGRGWGEEGGREVSTCLPLASLVIEMAGTGPVPTLNQPADHLRHTTTTTPPLRRHHHRHHFSSGEEIRAGVQGQKTSRPMSERQMPGGRGLVN